MAESWAQRSVSPSVAPLDLPSGAAWAWLSVGPSVRLLAWLSAGMSASPSAPVKAPVLADVMELQLVWRSVMRSAF